MVIIFLFFGYGKKIWVFRWRETRPDGRRAPRKRVIGTLEEYPTRKAAENAALFD
jgi:hypothetical protein